MDAPAVSVKTSLDFRRVAVGLPKAAAGKILPVVFDESDDILQRIAQKYANLVGKLRTGPKPEDELRQQAVQICV